jgi:hypothetical protein
MNNIDLTKRHPATQQLARWFDHGHLKPGTLARLVSRHCAELAEGLLLTIPDGPELTAGLRKLLEAKDCFVRAALDASDDDGQRAPAGIASEEPDLDTIP